MPRTLIERQAAQVLGGTALSSMNRRQVDTGRFRRARKGCDRSSVLTGAQRCRRGCRQRSGGAVSWSTSEDDQVLVDYAGEV